MDIFEGANILAISHVLTPNLLEKMATFLRKGKCQTTQGGILTISVEAQSVKSG
jgi:hypothetical protein